MLETHQSETHDRSAGPQFQHSEKINPRSERLDLYCVQCLVCVDEMATPRHPVSEDPERLRQHHLATRAGRNNPEIAHKEEFLHDHLARLYYNKYNWTGS